MNAAPISVCSRNVNGSVSTNKLGNRVFLRFNTSTTVNAAVTAIGAVDPSISGSVAAEDPDIFVWRRGARLAVQGTDVGTTETTTQAALTAGVYIIEVYDFELSGLNTAPRCMTVSVTGN